MGLIKDNGLYTICIPNQIFEKWTEGYFVEKFFNKIPFEDLRRKDEKTILDYFKNIIKFSINQKVILFDNLNSNIFNLECFNDVIRNNIVIFMYRFDYNNLLNLLKIYDRSIEIHKERPLLELIFNKSKHVLLFNDPKRITCVPFKYNNTNFGKRYSMGELWVYHKYLIIWNAVNRKDTYSFIKAISEKDAIEIYYIITHRFQAIEPNIKTILCIDSQGFIGRRDL